MFTSHKQISPPSLVLKLKISEVSQKWIPKAVELKRIPTHKKCKCKKFCSQTRLVCEIYSSDVIMHRDYSCNVRVLLQYCTVFLSWPCLKKTGLSVTINITRQLLIKSILLCNLPVKFNFGSFAVREPRCDNEDMQCVPTSCNDSQDDPVVRQVKTLIISS